MLGFGLRSAVFLVICVSVKSLRAVDQEALVFHENRDFNPNLGKAATTFAGGMARNMKPGRGWPQWAC